jgi:hypothetical protein
MRRQGATSQFRPAMRDGSRHESAVVRVFTFACHMRTILLFALLFAAAAVAADRSDDGDIAVAKFELSTRPAEGRYAPWRDPKNQIGWYAGEVIMITNASFRYTTFSDVIDPKHPCPDFSGPLKVFPDHVYLDHPGMRYPYRVAGRADGTAVLVTWEGYEQWKKSKKIFELDILWLWKDDAKEANKTVQRTEASRSAEDTNRTSPAAGSRH